MSAVSPTFVDPATTQFLTRDPLVATTRSPYGYVAGNPLNLRDPSGLDGCNSYQYAWDECESVLNGSPRSDCLDARSDVEQLYMGAEQEVSALLQQSCQGQNIDQRYLAQQQQTMSELAREANALANNKLNDPNFDPGGLPHSTDHSFHSAAQSATDFWSEVTQEGINETINSTEPVEWTFWAAGSVGSAALTGLSAVGTLVPF